MLAIDRSTITYGNELCFRYRTIFTYKRFYLPGWVTRCHLFYFHTLCQRFGTNIMTKYRKKYFFLWCEVANWLTKRDFWWISSINYQQYVAVFEIYSEFVHCLTTLHGRYTLNLIIASQTCQELRYTLPIWNVHNCVFNSPSQDTPFELTKCFTVLHNNAIRSFFSGGI